jgi:predicted ATPase
LALLERDRQMRTLIEALSAARKGKGAVALVRGEAGIGKSTLVRAFLDSVENEAHLLRGACDDLVTARPMGPGVGKPGPAEGC